MPGKGLEKVRNSVFFSEGSGIPSLLKMKSAGGEDWDYIQGLSSALTASSAVPPAPKATAC